ncbi:MAG: CBS domain-containing protein [Planctomycetota bacterium]
MPTAADVMNRSVVSLSAELSVGETIDIFVNQAISGAPVVEGGKVVGVVSELELFDVLFDPSIREMKIRDIMSLDIVAVEESEPIANLAHLFAAKRVRRVPVLYDGAVVGVVSRRDLLRFANNYSEQLDDPIASLMCCTDEDETLSTATPG